MRPTTLSRHHDHRPQSQTLRMVGNALRVVAGRGRDHAGHRRAALEQRSELVERAALLERSSELQVLELQEDSGADDLR